MSYPINAAHLFKTLRYYNLPHVLVQPRSELRSSCSYVLDMYTRTGRRSCVTKPVTCDVTFVIVFVTVAVVTGNYLLAATCLALNLNLSVPLYCLLQIFT